MCILLQRTLLLKLLSSTYVVIKVLINKGSRNSFTYFPLFKYMVLFWLISFKYTYRISTNDLATQIVHRIHKADQSFFCLSYGRAPLLILLLSLMLVFFFYPALITPHIRQVCPYLLRHKR